MGVPQSPEVLMRLEKIRLLQEKAMIKRNLPHLHGFKWYKWARLFFESRNKVNLLVAGNQLSKSSTNIRKCIDWATDVTVWPELWDIQPRQFWYMYPDKDVATVEFKEKWVPEFLPRNEHKDHPVYGWKETYDARKKIYCLTFNSGVTIYFKAYSQAIEDLQTATVHAVFTDEEMPEEHFNEISARLNATDGYFHMVFTATLGQDLWRRAMERVGKDDEAFPDAFKQSVSVFDCMYYEDGTPSRWTHERIKKLRAKCTSENEWLKRGMGRFVVVAGRVYSSYDPDHNRTKFGSPPVPDSWHIYSGVDIGSGGVGGHPAAMVFVAVSPEYRAGRVIRAWRGDGIVTSSGDILDKFLEIRGALRPIQSRYDSAAKDFGIIAERRTIPFLKAEKGKDSGQDILNTLFGSRLLTIDRNPDYPALDWLDTELQNITHSQGVKAKDDLADATRYALVSVPWDLVYFDELLSEAKSGGKKKVEIPVGGVDELAREGRLPEDYYARNESDRISSEIEEWNEMYG